MNCIKIHTELYNPCRSAHKTAFQNWKKPHPKAQTLENWLTTLSNPTVLNLALDMKSHRSTYSGSLPKGFPWILLGQHKEEIVSDPWEFILCTPRICWWPKRNMLPAADSKNVIWENWSSTEITNSLTRAAKLRLLAACFLVWWVLKPPLNSELPLTCPFVLDVAER